MLILDQLVRYLGRNTVTVLLFHKVPLMPDPLVPSDTDVKQFERVLDFVMEQFNIVPLADVAAGLVTGRLPKNAACITFDDGYADWLPGVVPLLLRRNAHASFYLTTSQFDGVPMWHERVNHAVHHSSNQVLQVPDFDIPALLTGTLPEKRSAAVWLQSHLKHQPLHLRNAMLAALESACGSDPSCLPLMPLNDLKEIYNKGFAIGAHTINHPILTHTSAAEALFEIGGAREQLQAFVGGPIESFAYPNGRPGVDFLPQHISVVRQAGYKFALTTQHGVVRQGGSLYQMPRFTPWGPDKLRMISQILRNQMAPKLSLDES